MGIWRMPIALCRSVAIMDTPIELDHTRSSAAKQVKFGEGVREMTSEFIAHVAEDEIVSSDLLDMSVTVLKTLSDPARLQMLWALSTEDLSLSDLAQLVGVSSTVASQLLSRLRTAGVLQTRKSGRHVIYSMHDERSREFIRQTLDFARHRLELQDKA